MEIEVIPAYHIDHDMCLRCHRPLKNLRWRKRGFGRKCYAKHCKEAQQTLDSAILQGSGQIHEQRLKTDEIRQDRAPEPKINKAEKRAALEKAWQEEMARKDPEPTVAQKRSAEKRLLDDVDKALGLEEDGEESDPGEPAGEARPAKNERQKKTKAPKGQAVVSAAAFNRAGRSLVVNGRDNRA
jgi:hypothetical protein